MLIDNRSVQRALAAAGLYVGLIDGIIGTGSSGATRTLASRRAPGYNATWSDLRCRAAVEQAILADAGFYKLKIDGMPGPATQAAVEKWQDFIQFKRKPLPAKAVAYQRPTFPRQADVRKFYGDPGENQTMLASPYTLYLDWEVSQSIERFSIHEKCHDAALRAMKRILEHYGPADIHRLGLDQFGGCLNVRKMRNGRTLSMHSWGIAIDWDADRNPLRATSQTAEFAKPEYAAFLDLWEEEGFISLGRARNYDWMHVQAVRL